MEMDRYPLYRLLSRLRFGTWSLRGLASASNIGLGSAKTFLGWLEKWNLAEKKVDGRAHGYKMNLSSPLGRHIKILFTLGELNLCGFLDEILNYYVQSITLYGSAARGEDDEKSDIDILVITRHPMRILNLKSIKRLPRELSIVSYGLSEWKKKSVADKIFYDRVIADGIQLYGHKPMVR